MAHTLSEAYERLEEVVSDLVHMEETAPEIEGMTHCYIVRALERREGAVIERGRD